MTRSLSAFIFVLALLTVTVFSAACAEEPRREEDDRVILDLTAEDWVTTKTAHVIVNVEAAVNGSNSGVMRAEMLKAVNDLVKADWRLTSFDRSQDQTGLERWSTSFEARVPENQLGGLGDAAKKASKAGMQLSIGDIDFSPTLEEMETARAGVRTQLYKQANDQLASLNAAIPGRSFRIAMINFTGQEMMLVPPMAPMPHVIRGPMVNMAMASASPPPPPEPSGDRAEKITLTAHVVFAAIPGMQAGLASDGKR